MNAPTAPPDPRRELQTLLASRLALIVVESREESRVLALVREMSLKVRQGRGWGNCFTGRSCDDGGPGL